MKETTSIIPLIEKWEVFNKENKEKDINEFATWLLNEKQASASVKTTTEARGSHTEIAILITRLQRYLGMSVNPHIRTLGFTKEHEYNFLYQVSRMNKPNKNDLSKENMMELSTGRDVIRRLKEKGLVEEKENPDDKRAMLISITPKGKRLLSKSFGMIAGSFTDFLGDLTTVEQRTLIELLTKLNRYHAIKNKKEILSYL